MIIWLVLLTAAVILQAVTLASLVWWLMEGIEMAEVIIDRASDTGAVQE